MQVPFVDPLFQQEPFLPPLPLVGRERELFLIHMMLENVTQDRPSGPRALTISGDVGVGKTRLLTAIRQDAEKQGFHIFSANSYEPAATFPYFPFIEALRPLLRSSTPTQLLHYLATTPDPTGPIITLNTTQLISALARIFPELPGLLHISTTPELLLPEQEKFRLFDAIATLLEGFSRETPVLLCIDDLQWADSTSLELTMYLTVRLHRSRVALVGVTRPQRTSPLVEGNDMPAATAAATRALMDLMRHGLLLLLPLGALDEEAAARYLQALLPGELPPEIAQPLLTRAEGNPFYLEELVRTLIQHQQLVLDNHIWQTRGAVSTTLPDSITHAVEARLQFLSRTCHYMLQVAALCGHTFSFDVLAAILHLPEEELHTHISQAIEAGILTTPAYTFCQGIVREVLQNELTPQRARNLHQAIGKALEASYGHDAGQHAAELAHHYAASGDRAATLRWSLLASEQAISQQAHREAIGHVRLMVKLLTQGEPLSNDELSMQLPTLGELYLLVGELWVKLGELDQAVSAFQHALQHLQALQDIMQLARANRLLADVYRMQAMYDLAVAHHQAAQNAFDQTRSQQTISVPWYPGRTFSPSPSIADLEHIAASERMLFLQSRAMLDLLLNHPEQAETALWESHRIATELGDRASQAFVLHLVGYIRGWGEQIYEAIRLQEAANALYIELGDPYRAALGDQGLGIIYLILCDKQRASLYTLRGLERARRYGMPRMLASLHWNQAAMALVEGQWEQCDAYLQQAMQEATHNNDTRIIAAITMTQAELHFRRGNWSEAEKLFLDAIHAGSATEWHPGTLALYGHFLAVTGRRAAARTQLERATQITEPPGFAGHFYLPFLAEGYLHLDHPAQAATYLQRIRSLRGLMYYGQSVDRILGEVAAHAGDWETAERAFEEALILCDRVHNEPEKATIYYEQARTALMHGDPLPHIHALCERASALFQQYGMERAVTMVQTLQQGITQLPEHKTTHATAVSGYILDQHLTRRELEVLQLVAEGHTDREVAETLIISPRTVNRHLSNIFVKIDVPGRAAAVAYALRKGLV